MDRPPDDPGAERPSEPSEPTPSDPPTPAEPTEPGEELPAPPAAQATERWSLDPGAIIPTGPRPAVDPAPIERPRRRGRSILVAILAAMGVLAVAGGVAAFFLLRGSSAELLERVPADVDVVAVAYLDPSAEQKVNLARMTDAFPDLGGPDGLRGRLEELADGALDGSGLNFEDVRSWVGVEAAIAVDVADGTPQVALLVHVADRENAERMLAKLRAPGAAWEDATWTERDYLGVPLSISGDSEFGAPSYAFDDDVLIFSSHTDLLERVIDTHRGTSESMATAAAFQEVEAELPDGRLMVAFVDTGALLDELEAAIPPEAVASVGGLADVRAFEAVGWSVSAESHGVALDAVVLHDAAELTGAFRDQLMAPDHEITLLRSVPDEAWGVFAGQHLDFGIQDAIDQLESQDPNTAAQLSALGLTGSGGLLEAMTGDVAVEVAPDPTTDVGGALLLGVSGASAEDAVKRVADAALEIYAANALSDVPLQWQKTTHSDGTEISFLPNLFGAYALRDDMLVIGSSVEQVEAVLDASTSGSLAEDQAFTNGIETVPATDSLLFVDVSRVVESVRQALPAEVRASFDEDVRPYLQPVQTVALGSDADEARQIFRMFVRIEARVDADDGEVG